MFIFDFVAETILDQILDWIYGKIIGFLNDFFVMMNNMGVELFELPWVNAVTTFFSYLGWALFGVGLVVGAFECAIDIDWYDKEIGYYEKNPHQTTDEEMPYLSGSVIYSLRCSLLHEGNPNVDNDRLTKRNESLPIDHFVLKIERKNDFDIYSDGSGISDMFDQHSRSYRMSIRRVCLIICCVAEAYYKENKEKFHFNYEILDWDKATEHLPPIDMEAFMKALADPNLGE